MTGNPTVPYFVETLYELTVSADHDSNVPIGSVKAVDPDGATCPEGESCDCAKIKYTIQQDSAPVQFSIDPETGEIYGQNLVDLTKGVSQR